MVRSASEELAEVMLEGNQKGKAGSWQRQLVSLGELIDIGQVADCSCERDQ